MLDVRRLRVLREFANRGTIAATADALGYTPPAVSQQLAALEREAGVELLERSGRTRRLTPAGTELVARTESVLRELEAAEAALARQSTHVAGVLRAAAFPSAHRALLPPRDRPARARAPGARGPHARARARGLDPAAQARRARPRARAGVPVRAADRGRRARAHAVARGSDPARRACRSRGAGGTVDLAAFPRRPVGRRPPGLLLPHGRAARLPRGRLRAGDHALHQRLRDRLRAGGDRRRLRARARPRRPAAAGVAIVPTAQPIPGRRIFAAVRSGSGARPAVAAALEALGPLPH